MEAVVTCVTVEKVLVVLLLVVVEAESLSCVCFCWTTRPCPTTEQVCAVPAEML